MAYQGSGAGSGPRFCASCGQSLAANSNFCPACGAQTGAQAGPIPAAGVQPMRTDHIKHRNMIVQVILAIVTLGIYAV